MTDPRKPVAKLCGSARLYPELLQLEEAAERKTVLADCWKRVRREQSVVRWGAIFGAVAGMIVGAISLPISQYLGLSGVAAGSIIGMVAGLCGALALRRFVHKPLQLSIRRALVERGLPVCIACGYNLTGNVSGVCPECGTAVEKAESEP